MHKCVHVCAPKLLCALVCVLVCDPKLVCTKSEKCIYCITLSYTRDIILPDLGTATFFSPSIETQPQSFKVRPSADSYEFSYTTTLSYHFIQLLHTHTSLGAHKSAHMSAYMSFGAHKSLGAHMSAHTSACIYAFLPWDPICNIPFTLSHKQGNPYLIRMSVTD